LTMNKAIDLEREVKVRHLNELHRKHHCESLQKIS
jgi:hypothetical protein